jgi:hypothetical protein
VIKLPSFVLGAYLRGGFGFVLAGLDTHTLPFGKVSFVEGLETISVEGSSGVFMGLACGAGDVVDRRRLRRLHFASGAPVPADTVVADVVRAVSAGSADGARSASGDGAGLLRVNKVEPDDSEDAVDFLEHVC